MGCSCSKPEEADSFSRAAVESQLEGVPAAPCTLAKQQDPAGLVTAYTDDATATATVGNPEGKGFGQRQSDQSNVSSGAKKGRMQIPEDHSVGAAASDNMSGRSALLGRLLLNRRPPPPRSVSASSVTQHQSSPQQELEEQSMEVGRPSMPSSVRSSRLSSTFMLQAPSSERRISFTVVTKGMEMPVSPRVTSHGHSAVFPRVSQATVTSEGHAAASTQPGMQATGRG